MELSLSMKAVIAAFWILENASSPKTSLIWFSLISCSHSGQQAICFLMYSLLMTCSNHPLQIIWEHVSRKTSLSISDSSNFMRHFVQLMKWPSEFSFISSVSLLSESTWAVNFFTSALAIILFYTKVRISSQPLSKFHPQSSKILDQKFVNFLLKIPKDFILIPYNLLQLFFLLV